MKRYTIDFYDMMDGWIGGKYIDTDDLEEAKSKADELQSKLSVTNIRAGEHYGVIDNHLRKEVYCLEYVYDSLRRK